MFGQGELRLALLALLREEPRHGYELIKAIEELTGGEYAPSPGVVYPTLQMLEDEGLISEAEAEGSRKPFAVTESGIEELDSRADEVDVLMDRQSQNRRKRQRVRLRSAEHTSELQSLMRISKAVFCLKKKKH